MEITHIYFGGSFYPPHKAHTEMIKAALRHNKTAELLIVPTKQNPLKKSRGAEMTLIQAWMEDLGDLLSYQEFSRCRLETLELLSTTEKNYTVETLKSLASHEENWALLLGSDSASQFTKWKNPSEILKTVKELWIVPRGKHSNEAIQKEIFSVQENFPLQFLSKVSEISSTEIRNGTLSQPLDLFLSPRVLAVWKQLGS